jgi:hypothetical protein
MGAAFLVALASVASTNVAADSAADDKCRMLIHQYCSNERDKAQQQACWNDIRTRICAPGSKPLSDPLLLPSRDGLRV